MPTVHVGGDFKLAESDLFLVVAVILWIREGSTGTIFAELRPEVATFRQQIAILLAKLISDVPLVANDLCHSQIAAHCNISTGE